MCGISLNNLMIEPLYSTYPIHTQIGIIVGKISSVGFIKVFKSEFVWKNDSLHVIFLPLVMHYIILILTYMTVRSIHFTRRTLYYIEAQHIICECALRISNANYFQLFAMNKVIHSTNTK